MSTSTAQSIAQALREMILAGELAAGEPLKQEALAARLEVSRIPLREALLILEGEGLVELNLNRTAVVSRLSEREAHELYVMREALELAALREALPRIAGADIARAENALNLIDHAATAAEWSAHNWAFHAALYAPCGMPRLMQQMQALHHNAARYFQALEQARYRARSQRDHRALLHACKAGNKRLALNLLAQQLQLSRDTLVKTVSHPETN
jgi:DNA-binding GntR family transcriptional regulator